tara:strand:+ start:259 stop:561 length:303 start_codon:yes stop_codon:yes gene_type:complete
MTQATLNFDLEWPVASAPTDTSEAAAKDMKSRAPLLRERTLEQITNSTGLTADEIAANLGESILSIRPRVSELKKRGLIIKTDRRKRNHSGKAAIVWRAR